MLGNILLIPTVSGWAGLAGAGLSVLVYKRNWGPHPGGGRRKKEPGAGALHIPCHCCTGIRVNGSEPGIETGLDRGQVSEALGDAESQAPEERPVGEQRGWGVAPLVPHCRGVTTWRRSQGSC